MQFWYMLSGVKLVKYFNFLFYSHFFVNTYDPYYGITVCVFAGLLQSYIHIKYDPYYIFFLSLSIIMFILFFVFILETFFPYKTRFFSFDSDFADAISKPTIQNIQNIQNNTLYEEKKVRNKVQKKTILLPGFFETFPELRMKWPKWSRDKKGNTIPCATDTDCPFPQTCCDHPIIPRDRKFCCSGWGHRQMIPAYVHQQIQGF